MVQKILENIDQKVEQELLRINSEKEKALLELEKKYREEALKLKEKNLEDFRIKAKNKIEEVSLKKKTEIEFAILKEKNRIIQEVYQEVEKRIVSSPNFKKWIKLLLPKKIEGKIIAGKKTAVILKDLVDSKIEEMDEEGFIVINKEIDFDFRISELLKRFKEDPEIISLLFSC
jgi:hypothetical protein